MEPTSPAEELPALYRAILDRVADLEAAGERAYAGRLRTAATEAYSRAWDERARRRLSDLLRRATLDGAREGHRGRSRRSASLRPRAMVARER